MADAKAGGVQPADFEKTLAQADTKVASFDERERSPIERIQHFLHSSPSAVPLLVLIASVAIFGVINGSKFFSPFALTLILQQVAIVGIIGSAQTLIILTAGIDLSVGAIMVLCSVVMGRFSINYGLPPAVGLAAGLTLGLACGAFNGFLVARIKLPPFIVTLGTWSIYSAANYIYAANETIRSQDIDAVAPVLHFFGQKIELGQANFTFAVILMIALAAFLWYVLNHTAWGRHVYAIGDDPEAARLSGINVDRMLITVYAVAGLICAVAGWVLIGRIGSVSPQGGQNANIESITAAVIGGTSLFGGRGSILGTVFGALIVGVFGLGLRLWGTDPQWTYLTVGALIIIAVATDQWIRKVSA
ncbi:ABC transporter permease [Dongia sedimenti]|uniref:ABC transporter permease n=1 Tax=Dongia sedimenti TaxID=3064282 RepID=A0ABU0YVY7_9PROT|nr:ABC transporter permease [Rhodospirillaceae bacterium R-7]